MDSQEGSVFWTLRSSTDTRFLSKSAWTAKMWSTPWWSPESSCQSTRMPLDRSHSISYLLQSRQSTSTRMPQEIRSDKLWTYYIWICGDLIATRPTCTCIVSFWTIKIKIPKSKRNTSRNGVFVNQRIECPTIFRTVKKVKKMNKKKWPKLFSINAFCFTQVQV